MSTSYTCSACRRNILAGIRRRSFGQLPSHSTFVSVANTRTSKCDEATADVSPIGNPHSNQNGSAEPSYSSPPRKQTQYSRGSRAEFLESLFEEGQSVPSASQILPNPKTQAVSLLLYERVETFKDLLFERKEPIDSIWHYFTAHLSAPVWGIGTSREIPRPLVFKAVTGTLLHRLQMERKHSKTENAVPSVTEITSTYASLGLLHPADWKNLVYDLLRRLPNQRVFTHVGSASKNQPELFNEHLAISEDILGAWRVLCKYYGLPGTRKNPQIESLRDDWSFLRYPGELDLGHAALKGDLDEIFLSLWARCPRAYASSMTSAALVTFSLITSRVPKTFAHVSSQNPFMMAVARLLVAARCGVKDILNGRNRQDLTVNNWHIDWSSTLRRAEEAVNQSSFYKHPKSRHSAVRLQDLSLTLLSQDLQRAMTERNLKQIDNLWRKAQVLVQGLPTAVRKDALEGTPGSDVNSRAAILARMERRDILAQDLYNQFIVAYMGLRHQDRALSIWQHMTNVSLEPNLSTWRAMLEGCRRARTPIALESIWTRLRSSTFQPDMACWRIRISGLIECGKLEQAIRALDEMGREWREASKKHHLKPKGSEDTMGPVKPTIETINDTVSGLLNRGLHDAVKRILTWGDGFGIKPDIVTFNILIRGLIRDGRVESIPSMLAQMQEQGIQADIATFTTILDEIFKATHGASPDEQVKLTDLVFVEMEAAGVQPNRFTYNKIISSLLQSQPKDMKAVQAVLARMAAQNIEPSRDIYTMLIQHHFSQTPPNMEGVRSLLDRIRVSGAVLDHIFWDRVIEGYASIGDTANALAVLGRVDKEGSRVGWPALEMVLQALVENGEHEMARQVVRNVKMDRGGPPDIDQRGVEGQHSFWREVAKVGFMDA